MIFLTEIYFTDMDQPKKSKKKANTIDIFGEIRKNETPRYITNITAPITGTSTEELTTSLGSTGLGAKTANSSMVTAVEAKNQKALMDSIKAAKKTQEDKEDAELLHAVS